MSNVPFLTPDDEVRLQAEREAFEAEVKAKGFQVPDYTKENEVDAATGLTLQDIAQAENDLRKNYPEEVGVIEYSRVVRHQIVDNLLIREEAGLDPLTGAINRREYDRRVAKLQKSFERQDRRTDPEKEKASFSIVDLDVDDFKRINDTYGHSAGDEVLKELVRRVKSVIRMGDFIARPGGEEFRVVVLAANGNAGLVAEKLRRIIFEQPMTVRDKKGGEKKVRITASFGVATYASDLVETGMNADTCLYEAKAKGKDQVWIWDKDRKVPVLYNPEKK